MNNPAPIQQPIDPQNRAIDTVDNSIPPKPSAEPTQNAIIQTPAALQNHYLFLKELGHGAQAKIFLALRLEDQQTVTIKQLNIGSVKTWKEYDLFQREAKVLETIKVPGVARFYEAIDCLEANPPASYIVQEFIEGASLAQMLKSGHRFKVSEIYDIIIQLLKILQKLHAMTPPVIHRDIKPSNIMITPQKDGSYKVTLIDFGAVANPQVQSGGSTVAGTFGYMPPEQLMGHPEPCSDLYALAAVTVELFTGKSPAVLPQKDFRLIFEPDMEQFPPALISILRKMLEPKTEDRFKDIQSIIETFEQFKTNNFDLKNIKDSDIDRNQQLNERIKAIQSIGEDGNMEIWQGLSDSTPRAVPDAIFTYFSNIKKHHNTKDLNNYHAELNDDSYNSMAKILMVFFTFISLLTALICIQENSSFIGIAFLASFFIFLIMTIKIFKKKKSPSDIEMKLLFDPYSSNAKTPEGPIETIFNLIKNGRKTIATITSIEYIELDDKDISQENGLYICNTPSFYIKYKFNPPDDSKSEDLIHRCIVHTAPENHYKVGDPLPILYTLDKQYFGELIASIPFPFPLAEYDMNHLIHTQQNYLNQDISKDLESLQNTFEYKEHLMPILKSLNNPGRLAEELKDHAWLIEKDCLPPLLNLASQLLSQKDETIHFALMSSLSCSIHYSNEKSSQIISSFIIDYLQTPQSITVGAIKGIFDIKGTSYCDFSEELTQTIFNLYKNPKTPDTIKSAILENIRIPLKHAKIMFSDPQLTPLYTQFFAGWHCKLGTPDEGRQEAHHRAMATYYNICMGQNPKRDKLVFDKIWNNVYFWKTIPNEFWNAYFEVYDKAYPELQEHMKQLRALSAKQVPVGTLARLKMIGAKF